MLSKYFTDLAGYSTEAQNTDCKCIVHRVFAGVLESDVTCLKCKNVTSAFDPVLDISVDLRPSSSAKKKKNANGPGGKQSAKPEDGLHSLNDCLDR